jgi:hypothetical protein
VTALVRTFDGRELTAEEPGNYFDAADGGRALSLSNVGDEELRQKFRDNVSVVRPPATADALVEYLRDLEGAPSVRGLTELLL